MIKMINRVDKMLIINYTFNMKKQKKIVIYATKSGAEPFKKWLKKLKNPNAVQRINKRILNAAEGNFGDHRNLPGGLTELRFDAGWRVYLADFDYVCIILLLCGGDKNNKKGQQADIDKAYGYLNDFMDGGLYEKGK